MKEPWPWYIGARYNGNLLTAVAFTGGYVLFYGGWFYQQLVYFTLFITTMKNIKFLIAGLLFGVILVKSEVVSWFRIQEMFHLQSFHMYGVIGSAILVGMISIQVTRRFKLKTIHKESIGEMYMVD